MPCIDHCLRRAGLAFATLALGACNGSLPPWPASSPPPVPVESREPAVPGAAPQSEWAPAPLRGQSTGATKAPSLGAPRHARSWDEYKMFAAQRLVAASPAISYLGEVPEPLLAIPVLKIELNADGSVRRIQVTRTPTQAVDTVQLAIDAVKRAAPFGDVRHLPKPWEFSEVFLFDDNRRFKPRTLDL